MASSAAGGGAGAAIAAQTSGAEATSSVVGASSAEGDFLTSLAKLHAEQLFQQIVTSSAELKNTSHSDLTIRELVARFSRSLSSQVDAACQANSLDFAKTRLRDLSEASSIVVNGADSNGAGDDAAEPERSDVNNIAVAASTSSSSDYILAAGQAINSTNQQEGEDDFEGGGGAGASSGHSKHSKSGSKSFFRRFSLTGLVLGRGIAVFHKQHSDEVELSTSNGDLKVSGQHGAALTGATSKIKAKTAKLQVQVVKEGVLKMVRGDSSAMMDGKPCWEKCRVALVRASGGHMIEFFVPPKV